MEKYQKILAYKAIDENIDHTTARQIVRYVMECELWRQDTVSPSNEYLAKKYGWNLETTKVAISKAKKSQFITTTGYGKKRCLELNVSFLKGKMAEIYQKEIKTPVNFSDVVPSQLANGLANTLANGLANTFSDKNGSTTDKTAILEGDNNNSNNNNNNKSRGKRRFAPPSVDDVSKYCQERRNNIDPNNWYDFYSAKGWMIGKNKMKDWRAAVRTWEARKKTDEKQPDYSTWKDFFLFEEKIRIQKEIEAGRMSSFPKELNDELNKRFNF